MVITKLQGGLGNQMFQYALGRKLSLVLGTELLLDTTAYGSDAPSGDGRLYGLGYFNISARAAAPAEIRGIGYPYGIGTVKIKKRLDRLLGRNHIKFEPSVLEKKGDIYLDGFWQSEKYFKDVRRTLLGDFSLKKALSPAAQAVADAIRNAPHSVSAHVRRGDYVSNEKNGSVYGHHCGAEYYAEALPAVIKNAALAHVFLFSDDIEWVKGNLDIPYAKTFIPGSDIIPDHEQMVLMSLCQSHVIANSTFSWWGAWLDDTKDGMVAAPSVWTPGIDLPIDDILPPEWIRIGLKNTA